MFVQLVYKCLNFPINEDFLQYQLQHLKSVCLSCFQKQDNIRSAVPNAVSSLRLAPASRNNGINLSIQF